MSNTTLKKVDKLPDFLVEMFGYIDSNQFDILKENFADGFKLYFAHYVLHGVDKALGFVGGFDNRLPKYQHVMGDIYTGPDLIIFEGTIKVWDEDGHVISTPFWDKLELVPGTNKIKTMYALFSIAAFPEKYWKDLKV
jgi:hypothetical protein